MDDAIITMLTSKLNSWKATAMAPILLQHAIL